MIELSSGRHVGRVANSVYGLIIFEEYPEMARMRDDMAN